MSTSPSWFDQEKFSRLVKKVGPKPSSSSPAAPAKITPAQAPAHTPEKETKRLLRSHEFITPSSPKPAEAPFQPPPRPTTSALPSLEETFPQEHEFRATPPEPLFQANESVPAVPKATTLPESPSAPIRRTSPLPNLTSLFEYDKPVFPPPTPTPAAAAPTPAPIEIEPELLPDLDEEEQEEDVLPPEPKSAEAPAEFPALNQSSEDLATAWAKVSSLNEELDRIARERDVARNENDLLQSQLNDVDELAKERDELTARVRELSRIEQERDDARNETSLLRKQMGELEKAPPAAAPSATPSADSPELARAIEERDGARRDYATLREQFETLKLEQVRMRSEPAQKDPALQQELDSLRAQLASREEELNALKLAPAVENGDAENLRREMNILQGQLNQAKEEASIAQRGLALSQKALQETRDALREASEGSSQFRTKLENLKAEVATLEQQNMMLQAQNDQLSREFSAAKAKLPPRS